MNKPDLIQALKDTNNLSRSETEKFSTLFFDQMAEALAQGEPVEIRGLCSFFVKNSVDILVGTPKPVRRSRLRRRSCHFSKRERI
jgi:integration host factor subunit beta